MLNRPFRLSMSNSDVAAMRKENADLKLQIKEVEQDYKELKNVYESEVLMAKKGDSQLHNELREVYEKWTSSKAKVDMLEEKLKDVNINQSSKAKTLQVVTMELKKSMALRLRNMVIALRILIRKIRCCFCSRNLNQLNKRTNCFEILLLLRIAKG